MKKSLAALALAALLPVTASAADLNYTYLGVAYIRASNDLTDSVGNGFRLDGSWDAGTSGFSLEGGYQHERFGGVGFPIPIVLTPESYHIGGGYHFSLAKSVDLVTHADYLSAKTTTEIDGFTFYGPVEFSQSDHGYRIGAGIRAQLADYLELDAGLDHDDVGFRRDGLSLGCGVLFGCVVAWRQDGPENLISGAVRLRVYGPLVLGLEYSHSSVHNGNDWSVSARWAF